MFKTFIDRLTDNDAGTHAAMNDAFRHGLTIEDMLVAAYGSEYDLPDGDDADLEGMWRPGIVMRQADSANM